MPCDEPSFTYRLKPHAFLVTVPRACLGMPSLPCGWEQRWASTTNDGNLLAFFEDDARRQGIDQHHLARTGPWLDPT